MINLKSDTHTRILDDNTVEGVDTSTAGFIGLAVRGSTSEPVALTSLAFFYHMYGKYMDDSYKYRHLTYSVEQFFNNGGSRCYVMRVTDDRDTCASMALHHAGLCLRVEAGSVGAWGNNCTISITCQQFTKVNIIEKAKEGSFVYKVKYTDGFKAGDLVELQGPGGKQYNRIVSIQEGALEMERAFTIPYIDDNIIINTYIYRIGFTMQVTCDEDNEHYQFTLNPQAPDFVGCICAKDTLIHADFIVLNVDMDTLDNIEAWLIQFFDQDTAYKASLTGGETFHNEDPSIFIRGITAFQKVDDISIMTIPGVVIPKVQQALLDHCEEKQNRIAILDMPSAISNEEDMSAYRDQFDSSYGAIYHPWIKSYDPYLRVHAFFPPSGIMAGIYAWVDNTRGIFKAPTNEVLYNCVGLSMMIDSKVFNNMNTKGINCIRALPGSGIRVWGARTMSNDYNWKYVNIRRFFIYIKESMYAKTKWVTKEANDSTTWKKAEEIIHAFLHELWKNGAFSSSCEEDAFFVNIDPSTMTQEQFTFEVGVALLHPAEFMTMKVTQQMQKQS